MTELGEEDQSAITLEHIRARITPVQHELLRRLWGGGDQVSARALFRKMATSTSDAQRELEGLGGNLVVQSTGAVDGEAYVLRLLGAFVSEHGRDFEDVLARYLAYSVKRYEDEDGLKEITQAEVERDLAIPEPLLSAVYRLAMMALPSFASGGSPPPNWKLGLMRDIHYLADVRDWPRFVREHVLKDYDPAEPVREPARGQYLASRREAQYRRSDLPSFWTPDQLRLFISHVSEHKAEASALQSALCDFHIASFVAHEDIEPMKEWQDEILAALRSADAVVALLTSEFHGSRWTDQEVGFMMGRARPVVVVLLDHTEPYGFIGRAQAINGIGRTATQLARSLFGVLASHETTRKSVAEAVVAGFANSGTSSAAEENAAMLGELAYMDVELAARIRSTFFSNANVRASSGSRERAEGALRRWNM